MSAQQLEFFQIGNTLRTSATIFPELLHDDDGADLERERRNTERAVARLRALTSQPYVQVPAMPTPDESASGQSPSATEQAAAHSPSVQRKLALPSRHSDDSKRFAQYPETETTNFGRNTAVRNEIDAMHHMMRAQGAPVRRMAPRGTVRAVGSAGKGSTRSTTAPTHIAAGLLPRSWFYLAAALGLVVAWAW